MKGKVFVMIGVAITVMILLAVSAALLMGGGDSGVAKQTITLDEIVEETISFETSQEIMIPTEGTVFWPLQGPGNSTEIVMITGINVLISWSDDEQPPASRPLYENQPDEMILEVAALPYILSLKSDGNSSANNTLVVSSHSNAGSTRVDLDLKSTPVILSEGAGTNISFDQNGTSGSGNSGLYISVSCIAGHIEASRPALLRYNDRGDEISMTVNIAFKTVPLEVFEAWVKDQAIDTEW